MSVQTDEPESKMNVAALRAFRELSEVMQDPTPRRLSALDLDVIISARATAREIAQAFQISEAEVYRLRAWEAP